MSCWGLVGDIISLHQSYEDNFWSSIVLDWTVCRARCSYPIGVLIHIKPV